jgi:hypothetical protein
MLEASMNLRSIKVLEKGQILDETVLEKEITRINDQMKEEGYYKFNNDNQDIYFVADSFYKAERMYLLQ